MVLFDCNYIPAPFFEVKIDGNAAYKAVFVFFTAKDACAGDKSSPETKAATRVVAILRHQSPVAKAVCDACFLRPPWSMSIIGFVLLCVPCLFRQVFARIVERQATNVVRGGFGMLNVGQAFPALADVLDVVSPPPSSQRYA